MDNAVGAVKSQAQRLISTKERVISRMKRDIIDLLGVWMSEREISDIANRTRRENSARLKVVELIVQQNLIQALEIIVSFCQLIAHRLPSIESEREVPPDMKEAIATLCFVGKMYGELPSLVKFRSKLSRIYGEKYLVNLTKTKCKSDCCVKCKSDCCVNKQIIQLLLIPNPTINERNKLLKEMAMAVGFKWCPASANEDMAAPPTAPNSMSHLSIINLNVGMHHIG